MRYGHWCNNDKIVYEVANGFFNYDLFKYLIYLIIIITVLCHKGILNSSLVLFNNVKDHSWRIHGPNRETKDYFLNGNGVKLPSEYLCLHP